jgi:hypothetical protein
MLRYLYGENVWLENGLSQRKEGDRVGVGPGTEQVVEGNDPHGGHRQVIGGCLLSLSLFIRGFQDLLKVRPSSLMMLYGCI